MLILRVTAGPYYSLQERDQHLAATNGSVDWLWSDADELRFDAAIGQLRSCWLRVPETPSTHDTIIAEWLHLPPQPGTVQMATSAGFDRAPTSERWIDPTGQHLVALTPHAVAHSMVRARLRICPQLDLLVAQQHLCSWILTAPAQALIAGWAGAHPPVSDAVSQFLHNYPLLVSTPQIARMEERPCAPRCATGFAGPHHGYARWAAAARTLGRRCACACYLLCRIEKLTTPDNHVISNTARHFSRAIHHSIAFSVLVLQVFRRGSMRWLWLALTAPTLVNMTLSVSMVLGLDDTGAMLLVEGLVALFGLVWRGSSKSSELRVDLLKPFDLSIKPFGSI